MSTNGPASSQYWSLPAEEIFKQLGSNPRGLSLSEAQIRLAKYGPNSLVRKRELTPLILFLNQFKSPIVLILIFATLMSAFLQDWPDAIIILMIVFGSAILSFVQEKNAHNAAKLLHKQITLKTTAIREGQSQPIAVDMIVPGDVVLLSAGSLVPADSLVLEANDFFVNQAVLTGETFPAEKRPGVLPEKSSLVQRTNMVFRGTNVSSGSATALVVQTGLNTAYGQIAARLSLRPPETEFERGIRQPFIHSQPSRAMLIVTLLVALVALALPYSPLAGILGFQALPFQALGLIAAIVILYFTAAEIVKRWFFRHVNV